MTAPAMLVYLYRTIPFLDHKVAKLVGQLTEQYGPIDGQVAAQQKDRPGERYLTVTKEAGQPVYDRIWTISGGHFAGGVFNGVQVERCRTINGQYHPELK